MNMFDKLEQKIAEGIAARVKVNIPKLMKRFGYKTLKEIKEDDIHICSGNGGKVFDTIVVGNNKASGEKVLILVKSEEGASFKLILDTKEKDMDKYVEAVNNDIKNVKGEDISKYLKNKSYKITFLISKMKEVLGND